VKVAAVGTVASSGDRRVLFPSKIPLAVTTTVSTVRGVSESDDAHRPHGVGCRFEGTSRRLGVVGPSEQVCVGRERHRGVGVTQLAGHEHHIQAVGDEQGGESVAERVQRQPRCDGSKTLRTLAMEVFEGRSRDPARRTEEIEAPLRQLVAAGFMVPVKESA
jgi:hypothetical protein